MANTIYVLMFTGVFTLIVNILLQSFIIKSRLKRTEAEWVKLKSLLALSSFKNYLDVVSADEAQELLEELLAGLRTSPSINVLSSEVEQKLRTLKGGLKALLDSLELVDNLNVYYLNAKKNYSMGVISNYVSIIFIIMSLFMPFGLMFLGVSLGLGINSLVLLLNSLINIQKINGIKKRLKNILQQ